MPSYASVLSKEISHFPSTNSQLLWWKVLKFGINGLNNKYERNKRVLINRYTCLVQTQIMVAFIHETLAKAHDLQSIGATRISRTQSCLYSLLLRQMGTFTSLSLFPFESKSLPPAAPPSLYGDKAFFRVCKIEIRITKVLRQIETFSLKTKPSFSSSFFFLVWVYSFLIFFGGKGQRGQPWKINPTL